MIGWYFLFSLSMLTHTLSLSRSHPLTHIPTQIDITIPPILHFVKREVEIEKLYQLVICLQFGLWQCVRVNNLTSKTLSSTLIWHYLIFNRHTFTMENNDAGSLLLVFSNSRKKSEWRRRGYEKKSQQSSKSRFNQPINRRT